MNPIQLFGVLALGGVIGWFAFNYVLADGSIRETLRENIINLSMYHRELGVTGETEMPGYADCASDQMMNEIDVLRGNDIRMDWALKASSFWIFSEDDPSRTLTDYLDRYGPRSRSEMIPILQPCMSLR